MRKKKNGNKKDLDDPEVTLEHREIIFGNPFLKQIYIEWYRDFIRVAQSVKAKGIFLEIGSGGGFLKSLFPDVVTSDIMNLPDVDMICNAENLPFDNRTISCIMMLNAFHHIPRPYMFLEEAQRTLVEGGKIIMTEPANSIFSRFIYTHFHHEPFDPKGGMEISQGNPLSNSNQAFPYIYFERETSLFEKNYGSLKINSVQYHTPLRYILSGGLSHKPMVSVKLYKFAVAVEKMLSPLSRQLGLFCTVEIEKTHF
ncbi:MAG: class I SAM-dependent methyltransferase [Bacteroidales bacterium]|nr:class I SAM-dependent methyltransferase [Bacteroidales bacterium]